MESSSVKAHSAAESNIPALVNSLHYRNVCGIEVKNSTEQTLHDPTVSIQWGYLYKPPDTTIEPGRVGTLVGHKGKFTTGTTGVVSWLIGDTGTRLVIMWSAPFNFAFTNNKLAIGFLKSHDKTNIEIYRQMYSGFFDNGSSFVRHDFRGDFEAMSKAQDNLIVKGIMGNGHKTVATIELKES